MVPVRVPASIRRRVRILASQEDKRLQQMVTELLDAALKQRGA